MLSYAPRIISTSIQAKDLSNLRDLFHSLDLNGDGLLQRAEFQTALMSSFPV